MMLEMTPRLALALAAVAYAVLVTGTSGNPDPRAWGVNLPGYLPGPERILVLGLLWSGAALLLLGARARSAGGAPPPRRGGRPGAGTTPGPWLLLLPLLAVLFYSLRVATHLLGDGQVWIDNLAVDALPAYSEPLSSAVWNGYAWFLRAAGTPVGAATLAYLPIACGMVASLLMAALASELCPSRKAWIVSLLLLLALGTTQLYFGYIESYPVASLALLAYLWIMMRATRGAAPVWAAGLLLAAAVAAHVIFVFLVPSYAWLALRNRAPRRRALDLAVPVVAAAALFSLLRFGPSDFLRPFGRVAGAAESSPDFRYGLAGALTARHVLDLGNLALLTAPVPFLLVLARALGRRKPAPRDAPPLTPLLLAGLPGLLAAAVLVVPGSPAQDWDLMSMTVWPAAVFALALGQPVLTASPRAGRVGLVLLSIAGLAAFVLTNAGAEPALRRFASLVGPASELSPHERAYGNEKLVQYYVGRREFEAAVPFARRMLDAEPTNPRYWVKAGAVFCGLGRYGEAAPYFEEALRRGPGRADALYNLGLCYLRVGRRPEARTAFRAAVEADSTRPDYRQNLGVALYQVGEIDSARAVWEEVLRRWPGYPLTRLSLERHFGPGGDAVRP